MDLGQDHPSGEIMTDIRAARQQGSLFCFFVFLGSRHASTDLVDGMRRKRLRIVSRWLISSLFSIYATQSSSDSDSDIAVSHDASSWNSDSLVVNGRNFGHSLPSCSMSSAVVDSVGGML